MKAVLDVVALALTFAVDGLLGRGGGRGRRSAAYTHDEPVVDLDTDARLSATLVRQEVLLTPSLVVAVYSRSDVFPLEADRACPYGSLFAP